MKRSRTKRNDFHLFQDLKDKDLALLLKPFTVISGAAIINLCLRERFETDKEFFLLFGLVISLIIGVSVLLKTQNWVPLVLFMSFHLFFLGLLLFFCSNFSKEGKQGLFRFFWTALFLLFGILQNLDFLQDYSLGMVLLLFILGVVVPLLKEEEAKEENLIPKKKASLLIGLGLGITPNSLLEQFDIIPLIPMKIGNLYFSFTNPSLFMLLTLSLVLLLTSIFICGGVQFFMEGDSSSRSLNKRRKFASAAYPTGCSSDDDDENPRKKKFRYIRDIYLCKDPQTSTPAAAAETAHQASAPKNWDESEPLSRLLEDSKCPSLSPPRIDPVFINNPHSPTSTSTSSGGSDMNQTLSSSAEDAVCALQNEITQEVSSIAKEEGIALREDDVNVLASYVYSESSNRFVLKDVVKDLKENKGDSEWFRSAKETWAQDLLEP